MLDSTAVRHVDPCRPRRAAGPRRGRAGPGGSRGPARPDGVDLLGRLIPEPVPLLGSDDTVAAAMGRLDPPASRSSASPSPLRRGGRPTPAGFRLLTRAARLADRAELPLLTLIDLPSAAPEAAAENAGQAAAIAEAMDAVLGCRAATVGVLVGEGGSGGAMAAACCDALMVCPSSYFAALGPEGAAVTLRQNADDAARLMAVRPADLLALGVADGVVPGSDGYDRLRRGGGGRGGPAGPGRARPTARRPRAPMVEPGARNAGRRRQRSVSEPGAPLGGPRRRP